MTTMNELSVEIDSVFGDVPRRPILVIEYPVGTSLAGYDYVDNAIIARQVIEAIQRENNPGSGVAIPIEINIDGKPVSSWSLLKSPGWRVYQLFPPEAEQAGSSGDQPTESSGT